MALTLGNAPTTSASENTSSRFVSSKKPLGAVRLSGTRDMDTSHPQIGSIPSF